MLGPPQSTETGRRPDEKLRPGFTGAPAAAGGSKNKQGPLLTLRGVSWSLTWVWGSAGGELRGVPTPAVVVGAGGGGTRHTLLWLPAPLVTEGFSPF